MREWLKAMHGEDYDYRKMVKGRVLLGKVYMGLGVLEILVMGLLCGRSGEFAENFYLYSGIAIIVCGFLIARKNRKLLSFQQELSKMEIREKDERFRSIGTRSWAMAGYVMMLGAARLMDFHLIYRLSKLLFAVLLALMIVPLFGAEQFGSRAWIYINLGITTVSVQPSEFAKPFMIVLIASYFFAAQHKRSMQASAWQMLKFPLFCYAAFVVVILLQKDIGALAIVTLICFGCVQVPTFPSLRSLQKWTRRIVAAGICLVLLGMTPIGLPVVEELSKLPLVGHVASRFANAANPLGDDDSDLYGQSYQPANALYGIANSNIVGQGIGGSSRKFGYLTQADSDYILAIVIEETGIFGLGFIAAGYGILLFRLFKYAFKTSFVPYKVVLSGGALYFFAHFVLNIGGVSALIPLTGVPLLFISSGGTALVSSYLTIGICQNVIANINRKELSSKEE